MVAGHICSYACLLGIAVNDPHNLCYFKDQPVCACFVLCVDVWLVLNQGDLTRIILAKQKQESEGLPEHYLCYFPELLY